MVNNNLKLTDNGEVHFFEDISNGTNKLITKGPAALSSNATWTFSSVDLDFSSLTHTASGTEFITIDDSGAIGRSAGSATLDGAYDAGDTITVDDGAVTLNGDADNTVLDITQTTAATTNVLGVQNSGTGDAVQIDQDGEGVAADINATHTGSNNVVDITNAGTGDALQITQAGAGIGLQIDQNGEAVALDVNATHTGSNNVVDIQNSGTGDALMLTQDGEGIALHIDQNATGALRAALITNDAAGDALEVNQNGDGLALDINKTNTDTAKCVAIDNDSSGQGLHITQNGAGIGLQVDQNADAIGLQITSTTGTADVMSIVKSGGDGKAVSITHGADAVVLDVNQTNAAATAAVLSLVNSGDGDSVTINHDGTSGSAISITNHDSTDPAVDIDVGEASEGVQISGAVSNNKTLVVTATNIGGPVVELNSTDSGGSTVLGINNSSTTGKSLVITDSGSATVASVDNTGDTVVNKLNVNSLALLAKSTASVTSSVDVDAPTSFVELHSVSGTQALDVISTQPEGTILILHWGANTVTLRDESIGGGNIQTASDADMTFSEVGDTAMFMSIGASGWVEVSRSEAS